jgi:hypothetical protein
MSKLFTGSWTGENTLLRKTAYEPGNTSNRFCACCGSYYAQTREHFYTSTRGITMYPGDVISDKKSTEGKNHTEYVLLNIDGEVFSMAFRTKWKAS